MCEKNCPEKAPKVESFLAIMDYSKCNHTCYCVAKCKPATIVIESRPGETPLTAKMPPKKEAATTAGAEKA
jgi:Fe-S-cluster-containing hydrogenase component 2